MFGVLLAVVCAFALFRLWRRPYRGGPPYGQGGCGGGWGHGFRGDAFRDRAWSRQVIREVDATPLQERAIHDAHAEVVEAARRRQRAWGLSNTVAEALESDTFDRDVVSARLNRDETDPFRAAVMSAIERLHAALDPAQRRAVASRVRGSWPING